MGKIHINRNRQSIGEFSQEEVGEGLKSGRFLPDDLAWREPMDTWLPLSEFPGFNASKDDEVPVLPEGEALPPLQPEPAWERRSQIGFFTALVETVWQILSAPLPAFQKMKLDGGLTSPLLFYVITGWVGQTVAFVYSEVMTSVISKYQPSQQMNNLPAYWTFLESHPFVYIVIAPITLTIGIFIMSGFYHVCLLVLGGANKPFEATFRVCAYGAGAISALLLVPLCGSYIYLGYFVVVLSMGLKEAHQTTWARAIGTVAISVFLCCGVMIGVGAFYIAGNAALHNLK